MATAVAWFPDVAFIFPIDKRRSPRVSINEMPLHGVALSRPLCEKGRERERDTKGKEEGKEIRAKRKKERKEVKEEK